MLKPGLSNPLITMNSNFNSRQIAEHTISLFLHNFHLMLGSTKNMKICAKWMCLMSQKYSPILFEDTAKTGFLHASDPLSSPSTPIDSSINFLGMKSLKKQGLTLFKENLRKANLMSTNSLDKPSKQFVVKKGNKQS